MKNSVFCRAIWQEKVDPYLRPLYDALGEMFGIGRRICASMERGAIEVAPLAYMRGRTLVQCVHNPGRSAEHDATEQMKMFLTRIGRRQPVPSSPATITQIDLQRNQKSGLVDALNVLKDVRGIAFSQFTSADIVRHPLVARIVDAYETADKRRKTAKAATDATDDTASFAEQAAPEPKETPRKKTASKTETK